MSSRDNPIMAGHVMTCHVMSHLISQRHHHGGSAELGNKPDFQNSVSGYLYATPYMNVATTNGYPPPFPMGKENEIRNCMQMRHLSLCIKHVICK